jgi:peptide/nickel transport system substrate-binding protein
MRVILSRRLAAISAATLFLLAALPASTARRPRRGGTLRVEIGAAVTSLDAAVAAASAEEAAAKAQIEALIYDHRNPDGTFSDPGPFRIAEWEPGKHATVAANEDYPGGRPFVDAIEIQMGRAAKDRLVDLEVNKIDFAEIPPEQVRRAAERGTRVSTSQPDELVALVFIAGRPAANDARAREAIANSIDRAAIVDFILQKEGEAAGGLLPQWSSGTAFLFSTAPDAKHAKELWAQITPSPKIALGYDPGDPQEQTIAERIAVNAREAGISMTAMAIPSESFSKLPAFDARLMRMTMASRLPRAALANFAGVLDPLAGLNDDPLPDPASPEQIYEYERSIVRSFSVVPIAWVPKVYGLSARVRDWKAPGPGETWPLADVWLDSIGEASIEKVNP